MKWKPWFDGCETPYDLGWCHGTEDQLQEFKFRPGCQMTRDEYEEYMEGYKDAFNN